MSGFPGMNNHDDPYGPHRRFIERLSEEIRQSEKIRRLPNRELARQLYRIAEACPEAALVCYEAAERLVPDLQTATPEKARRN